MPLRVREGWFLEVGFHVTYSTTASSEADAVIFGTRNCHLHFGALGNDFGSLGAPWGANGPAEGTPLDPESDF